MATLSLSISMIIIAIIRMSGYQLQGVIDLTWQQFWQFAEACVAVLVVSLSVFRSAFVASKRSKASDQKKQAGYWQQVMRRRKVISETQQDEMVESLPKVPGATMTGIRTLIRDVESGSGAERQDRTPSTEFLGDQRGKQ